MMTATQYGATESQISEVVQTEIMRPISPPQHQGETLLSQYKMCNAINQDQLRNAKNIQDLVNIKVTSLDKQLYMQSGGGHRRTGTAPAAEGETSYNLQFDPINFLQKVPCMGDREFLINQSILHNSTTKNRVSEAMNRQRFMQQQHANKFNRYSSQHGVPHSTKNSNGGLQRLLPQLPKGGFSVKVPKQQSRYNSLKSHRSMRTSGNKRSLQVNSSLVNHGEEKVSEGPEDGSTLVGQVENQDTEETEAENFEQFSKEMLTKEEMMDPVKTLQSIFRKHEAQKRNPGVNLIAEKYKNLARSQNSGVRASQTITTSGTGDIRYGWPDVTASFSTVRESLPYTPGMTPGSSGTFFSKPNVRQSYPVQPKTAGNHILLQHEDTSRSRIGPPATAPHSVGKNARNGYRGSGTAVVNKDIDDVVSVGGPNMSLSDYNTIEQEPQPKMKASGNRLLKYRNQQYLTIDQQKQRQPPQQHVIVANQENSLQKRPSMPMTSQTLYPVDAGARAQNSRKTVVSQRQDAKGTQRSTILPTNSSIDQPPQQQHTLGNMQTLPVPIVSDSLTQKQVTIREKLHKMRQLFEDEDAKISANAANDGKPTAGLSRPESSEWDLHNHRLIYEETLRKRQQHLETVEAEQGKGGQQEAAAPARNIFEQEKPGKSPSAKGITTTEMHENDLRDFLKRRIDELHADQNEEEVQEKFKFKASTISNVLPSGHVTEQSRLEANYKNRLKNKGEKLHQKLMTAQQKLQQKQSNAIRQSHLRELEQQKRDVVSNRSKIDSRTNSPCNSEPTSPGVVIKTRSPRGDKSITIASHESTFRKRAHGSSAAKSSSPRQKRQINTDLEGAADEAELKDEEHSTQHGSMQVDSRQRHDGADGVPQNKLTYTPLCETPMKLQDDRQQPITAEIQLRQQVISEQRRIERPRDSNVQLETGNFEIDDNNMVSDDADFINQNQTNAGYNMMIMDPHMMYGPQLGQDQEIDEAEEKEEKTAVIFLDDNGDPQITSGAQGNKRVNYFTHVLRQIDLIDRQYERIKKQRKLDDQKIVVEQMRIQEEMLIEQHAKQHAENCAVNKQKKQSQESSGYQTPDTDDLIKSPNRMLQDSGLSEPTNVLLSPPPIAAAPAQITQNGDLKINQDMRKSLEHALMQHNRKTGDKPEDVIILQVTDRDENKSMSIDYNQTEKDHEKSRSQDGASATKNHSQANIMTVVQNSRSQSETSNKSRVDTAENGLIEPQGQIPPLVQTVQYSKYKRGSEVTTSQNECMSPASHSLVILNHGQKYSHHRPSTFSNDPVVTVKLPAHTQQLQDLGDSARSLMADGTHLNSDIHGQELEQQDQQELPRGKNLTMQVGTVEVPLSQLNQITPQQRQQINHSPVQYPGILPPSANYTAYSTVVTEQNGEQNTTTLQKNLALSGSPQDMVPDVTPGYVTGSQLPYFCPKRFNRYPRFTLFFKKDRQEVNSVYVNENTVSLNADFLKFLSAQNNVPQEPDAEKTEKQENKTKPANHLDSTISSKPDTNQEETLTESQKEANAASPENQPKLKKVPTDVEKWNDYLKLKKFDPFDKVVLVRGIDNSILTSFRTLKGQNNTVSDTFKIVHKKFNPSKTNNAFFKNHITNHVDKLPYQTLYAQNDLDNELGDDFDQQEDTIGEDFELLHRNDDGTFERVITQESLHEKLKLEINTNENQMRQNRGDNEFSSSKLQQTMTAALLDLEAQGSANQNNNSNPGRKTGITDKARPLQAPFRVLTDAKTLPLTTGTLEGNSSEDTLSFAVKQKSRMPRPKPLNFQQKPNSKERRENQLQTFENSLVSPAHIDGKNGINAPFGVHGRSPIIQIQNSKYQESIAQQQSSRQDQTLMPIGIGASQSSPGAQQVQVMSQAAQQHHGQSTGVNTHFSSIDATNRSGKQHTHTRLKSGEKDSSDRNDTNYKISPVRLIMQPNFQFNSTATVENNQEANNQDDSGYVVNNNEEQAASKSLVGVQFEKKQTEKSAELGYMTIMNRSNQAPPKKIQINKNPKSSYIVNQPVTPIQLNMQKKKTAHMRSPGDTEYLPKNNSIGQYRDKQFVSGSDIADKFDSNINENQRTLTQAVDLNSQKFDSEKANDVQQDLPSSSNNALTLSAFDQLPTVNVIKSNAAQVANTMTQSLEATDGGDTVKKGYMVQNNNYDAGAIFQMVDSPQARLHSSQVENDGRENYDFLITGQPIVHQALGGRKLQTRNLGRVNDSINSSNIPWNASQVGTSSSGLSPRTARNTKEKTPAKHVGPLQVPESLKVTHQRPENQTVEAMALGTGFRKGAVGNMIDKIYKKDRKMVNNMYKGNMLSTAVLTDMTRYHKLKSNTGVESKDYDHIYYHDRIQEEESKDLGLRLDCTNPAPGAEDDNQQPQSNDLAQDGARPSTTLATLPIPSTHVTQAFAEKNSQPSVASVIENKLRQRSMGPDIDMTSTIAAAAKTGSATNPKNSIVQLESSLEVKPHRDQAAVYGEMINRSEQGAETAFAKSHYNNC